MNTLFPRLVTGILAAVSGLALWEIIELKGAVLLQRPSMASMAALCCLLGALLGLIGCLVPNRVWERLLLSARRVRQLFAAVLPPVDHWSGSVLLSCSILIYFLLMINLIPEQPTPENNDQAAFLAQAKSVEESGGVSVLAKQLFSGDYTEANQHPLYVALLSFFPDYEAGKRLSAMFGLLALLIFSMGIAQQYGNLTGGLTGLLISVNAAYCQLTGRVVCEGLLLFFIAGLWLVILKLPDLRTAIKVPYLPLMAIGLLLGGAWLTKGTALLITLGILLWLASYAIDWRGLWLRLRRQNKNPETKTVVSPSASWKMVAASIGLIVVGFIVVALPLLVRNARVYGSPTFNANSYLMFEDEFSEPHALIQQGSLGAAARRYLETHSFSQMVKREVKGMLWQVFIFLRSLGPLPFDEGRVFFGMLTAPFLIVGLWTETGPARRLYLIWLCLFWLAFAWYLPIAAGERFLMPLLLPTLSLISLGLVRTVQVILQRHPA